MKLAFGAFYVASMMPKGPDPTLTASLFTGFMQSLSSVWLILSNACGTIGAVLHGRLTYAADAVPIALGTGHGTQ